MVLMLQEADDPEAKLALPGSTSPSINRLTVDGHSEPDTSEDEERETAVLLTQDPPPSYIVVQSFTNTAKREEEAERLSRARRRFLLALAIAGLLVAFPAILGLTIRLYLSSQNDIPEAPEPTPTPSDKPPRPPPEHPPWRGPPGPGGGGGGGGGGGPDRGGWNPDHPDHPDGRGPPRFPDDGRHGPNRGRRPEFPPPEDSEDKRCSPWLPYTDIDAGEDPSYVTSYSIPLNTSISIRSLLSRASGTLRVSLDEQLQGETAEIQIVASGLARHDLKDVSACLMTNKERYSSSLSLKGIGPSAETSAYSIHLRFPFRAAAYPGLMTDLPRFLQSFDNLEVARFDFIDIGGADSDVNSVSMLARFIIVHTYNGTVDGHFSVEKGLNIMGDLKPITITSSICDNGWGPPTFTRISSSQSPINAKVTLCNHANDVEDDRYGRYLLDITNSDSPISLQVEHAHPAQGSSFYLNVTNTDTQGTGMSHSMVTLDTGFEGTFVVRADGEGAPPVSVKSEDATDDDGGIRYVEIKKVENDGRLIGGEVFWDSPAPPLDRRGSGVWISSFGSGEASLVLLGD